MKHEKMDADVSAELLLIEVLLARLAKGDTEIDAGQGIASDGCLGRIRSLIGELAGHIRKTADYANETALGLCEHYDTLSRITMGDLSARTSENSSNELVAKLGRLINREAVGLTGAIAMEHGAEDDKQSQLQFLQTLIDTMPNPVYYKDVNGCYLGCNRAFESSAGVSRERLIGKTALEVWPAEQAENIIRRDRELLEKPGVQTYETSFFHADGSQHELVVNKATFHDKEGGLLGMVGVMLDITERKKALKEVAFQNILLTIQQEASIDGILLIDENARILTYNRRFIEIMNIPEQLIEAGQDEPVLAYVTGRMADPQGFLAKVKYLYENRHEVCRDEVVLCDGKTLDRYSVPLQGADGRYYGRFWSFRDVTERKAAELEVKHAYQQLLDIIDFLPDATFAVNKDNRVIAWNRAIEKLSGLKKEEVIGQGDYAYAVPFYGIRRPILIDLLDEDVDVIRQKYSFIKVDGKTLYAETYIPDFRESGECYLWGIATPLYDQDGTRVGAIESIRDITAHRCAEQEKSRLEAELHHARMMESFLVRLGHDLKTPLTPLLALLPLVRERVVEPDLRKMLDICCKSSGVINELTRKTSVLVDLASGVEPRDFEETRLYDVIENCLSSCLSMPYCKDARFENEIAPEIVVKAVPEQIHELFCNLVSNAVRYSPGKAFVRFGAAVDGDTVTVTVADQGIGLAAEHLELVFEEFYKVDESRHDLDAAGLGLSICRRIVQNHNGWIRAESNGPGYGTSIIFALQKYPADCLTV